MTEKVMRAKVALVAIRVVEGAWSQAWPYLIEWLEAVNTNGTVRDKAHEIARLLDLLEREIRKSEG
ncbi:MAG: hypothetical protein A2Z21_01875 [Candidatus Fraserbacteria bacterium RBG_16_55_9]|uniref:Uncharacterized protein n=1 Tax=Fraserbacteria sp. (strain RBG_16_55_9) TaxID=1817864 RepID=A0A1F5UQA1_FRAXR|nr:MAG: hypothetical protein A2Z21_01875 [Candidatus Fraserbacteria bacterium RBG_16_55_9]